MKNNRVQGKEYRDAIVGFLKNDSRAGNLDKIYINLEGNARFSKIYCEPGVTQPDRSSKHTWNAGVSVYFTKNCIRIYERGNGYTTTSNQTLLEVLHTDELLVFRYKEDSTGRTYDISARWDDIFSLYLEDYTLFHGGDSELYAWAEDKHTTHKHKEPAMAISPRKAVSVIIVDGTEGLDPKYALVADLGTHVMDHDATALKLQLAMDPDIKLADKLATHNVLRSNLVDRKIRENSGQEVNMLPLQIHELQWIFK